MTVRPFESFDFGPVGLRHHQPHSPWTKTSLILNIPHNDRALLILCLLERRLRGNERLRCPIIHELIYLLGPKSAIACCNDQRQQTSSDKVTYDFFWVEYVGDKRYLIANRTRKSSTADRTGSFW